MKEAQRFLRYVIPGFVFIIELLAYLLLAGDISIIDLINYGGNTSILISAFLISGGLGFIFGVFYYTLIWKWPLKYWGADLRPLLIDSVNQDLLILRNRSCDNEVSPKLISQRGAFRIVSSFWSLRKNISEELKGAADSRTDRLADIAHSLGTSVVASTFAFGGFCYFHLRGNGSLLSG